MKKLFLVLVLVLVTASFAVAREKTMTVKGEVASINTAANTLTIKQKNNKEVTLNVSDKTRVILGKERKGLADIKSGDEIMVWTTEKEGKTFAKSIRISIKKASHPEKAVKAKEKDSY